MFCLPSEKGSTLKGKNLLPILRSPWEFLSFQGRCPFKSVCVCVRACVCVIIVLPPFWKCSTFMAPLQIFFPCRVEHFSDGAWWAGKQTESHKSYLPCKKAENLPSVSNVKRGWVHLSDFCYFCYFSDWRLFCRLSPSHIKVYSGRKEFAPKGANSFLLEQTPLQEGGIKILTELLPLKIYLFY